MSRYRLPILLTVLCSFALLLSPARGDRLPSSVKSSTSPQGSRAQIKSLISQQVAALASGDPTAEQTARTTLVYEVESHSGATASEQYQTEYATDLAAALLPVVNDPKWGLRARLNAAVVTTEVAAKVWRGGGDCSVLTPLVQAFLKDKQPAVVLWGIKAARFALGSTVQVGNGDPLAKLIVKAAEANGNSGPIVEEAYNALTFERLGDKFAANPQFPAWVGPVLPDLIDLMEWRLGRYRAAADPPPSPQAERSVAVFLSVTAFPAVNAQPATRDRALKVMGEMTCSLLHAVANGNTSPELIETIKKYGDAFSALGQLLANDGMQTVGKNVSSISSNTDPNKMGNLCDGLAASLKAVGVNIDSGGGPGAAQTPGDSTVVGSSK